MLVPADKRTGFVLLRLACILSLWHAPVPWVHVHSPEDQQLAAHLRHFHVEPSTTSPEEALGWHWHLVLPPWGHDPSSSTEDDVPVPCSAVDFAPAIIAAGLSWDAHAGDSDWSPVSPPLPSSLRLEMADRADDCLKTSLQSWTARQFLSVYLC